MYTLDCDYYDSEFDTIMDLVDAVMTCGMDPNYEILKDGVGTGETLADYLVE